MNQRIVGRRKVSRDVRILTTTAALLMLGACTRMYTPLPAQVPTLRPGVEKEWGATAGFHGVDTHGALAVGPWTVGARAVGTRGSVDPYGVVGLSGSRGWSHPAGESVRVWSAGLELAGGVTPADRVGQLSASAQGSAAWCWKHATLAAALRTTGVHMRYGAPRGALSDSADGLFVEPVFLLRAGPEHWKAETQIGLSIPLVRRGDLGGEWPLVFGLGVSYAP